MMGATQRWGGLFECRLCWKIAAAVFALILAVESVILWPSAKRFEQGLLRQLADQAIIAIEPTLAASAYGERATLLAEGVANVVGQYGVLGVVVAGPAGRLVAAAGATEGLERQLALAAPMGEGARRAPDGRSIDLAWPTDRALTVAVRVDTSGVGGEVLAYTLRIAGLVAIIVLVVTAGTMLVLHRLVLRPVLRLRESSLAAGADPDAADRHLVRARRRDEMGELIEAHNTLLGRVAESKRRDREMAAERERFLVRHEPLTGLPNRAALIEHVDRIARRGACVTLLMANLLQFRLLNAGLGAERCDELLRRFAERLRAAVPPSDFLAHLGGDRFAILHQADPAAAAATAALAERILAETSGGYEAGGTPVPSLEVRIGISRAEGCVPEGRALLSEAELALARVKETEGAKYLFHSPELAEKARERQALARDLERAIEAGELYPVMQPRFALEPPEARLAGAEVLLRWKSPARGMVSPGEFIPLAESTGLIVPIGDFVLRAACARIRDWLGRYGWSPRLAVNLSARQFALPDLDARLERALAEADVPAALLEVEVTETAAMRDVERSARALAQLRSLGVKVSIDDFGTGYSSLNYLRRFAVDAIKIDKSFVDDIGLDRNAEAICDAILRLGQSIGTRVVAEGVENERQVTFLRRRRCDEVQGYFFGRPVPAPEFESAWLAARAAA
jgi:diguanylate cyclase (GGDEF)-like protein